MVGWHYQLSGHECEPTPGDSEGQGNLVYCSPWGHRVGRELATEQQQGPLFKKKKKKKGKEIREALTPALTSGVKTLHFVQKAFLS